MHQSQLYVQPSAEMQEQMEEAADRYNQARVPADVNNIPRVSWKPYLNTGECGRLFISGLSTNPFVPNEIPLSYQLNQSISDLRVVGCYFSFKF